MLVTVGHTAVSASVTVIVASSGARFSSAPIALSRASRLARKVGMSSRSRGQKNRPGLPAVFPNIEPHLLLLLGGHCRPFATIEAFAGTVDEDEDHVAVTNREGALVMVGGIKVGTLSKAAAEMIVGLILHFLSGVCCLLGTLQVGVIILVTLVTVAFGTTRLTVYRTLVAVAVTGRGVMYLVGIITTEGDVRVAGTRVVMFVAVVIWVILAYLVRASRCNEKSIYTIGVLVMFAVTVGVMVRVLCGPTLSEKSL